MSFTQAAQCSTRTVFVSEIKVRVCATDLHVLRCIRTNVSEAWPYYDLLHILTWLAMGNGNLFHWLNDWNDVCYRIIEQDLCSN